MNTMKLKFVVQPLYTESDTAAPAVSVSLSPFAIASPAAVGVYLSPSLLGFVIRILTLFDACFYFHFALLCTVAC